jgi:ribosome-binding ATPase YchF (GTP1/OBG family)
VKDVGLVGVPYAGKSTLFTALTRAGAAGGRANHAVVSVPDPRLEVLAGLERSRTIVPAQVRFVDVPGGTHSAQGIAALRETDALSLVLRAFGPDQDPGHDLAEITADLVLADLAVVEAALEGARRRARGRGPKEVSEVRAFERAHTALSEERLLRDVDLDPDERRLLRGLGPLTLKPWILVANLEEGTEPPAILPSGTVGVWAEIEAETAGMPEDEARALLEEFGVKEPGLDGVISACYRALDLITFLTTGEDETRAWEVRRGATAPEAAGAIHSDLQRGFIRAEVVRYDDLVAEGGWDQARAKGLLRVEGRDYVVQEGDVLHVRFAV